MRLLRTLIKGRPVQHAASQRQETPREYAERVLRHSEIRVAWIMGGGHVYR